LYCCTCRLNPPNNDRNKKAELIKIPPYIANSPFLFIINLYNSNPYLDINLLHQHYFAKLKFDHFSPFEVWMLLELVLV
ncbi:hypothetical protein, partial [Acinetobacter gerneri]|uniref:hypothetical protein n=1 Tax=Acinetobacter gerneri TaxID=202952 RepID=UPI001C54E579